MRCDLSRLLSRKITKRIHSCKSASLNRPILCKFLLCILTTFTIKSAWHSLPLHSSRFLLCTVTLFTIISPYTASNYLPLYSSTFLLSTVTLFTIKSAWNYLPLYSSKFLLCIVTIFTIKSAWNYLPLYSSKFLLRAVSTNKFQIWISWQRQTYTIPKKTIVR